MNCPYCDETIHPQAKYCAKCGLPLKEDNTVHSVSSGDDTGPSKIVIGALLGGIAIIGVLIVGIGNQKPNETQARKPDPPRTFAAPGLGSGIAGTRPVQPAFNNTAQTARPAFQAPRADANTTSQTRYVYTPPARVPMTPMPAPNLTPPPVPLLAITTAAPPRPGRVSVARDNSPRIPRLPDAVLAAAVPTMPDIVQPVVDDSAEAVNPNPTRYIWDPVHERWARRTDAPRRRANPRRQATPLAPSVPLRAVEPETE